VPPTFPGPAPQGVAYALDVSERKRIEVPLRTNEAKFRKLALSPRAAQRAPGARSQHELHNMYILRENRDYEVSLAPSGRPNALKKAKHSC
jgi:hypothetical protein